MLAGIGAVLLGAIALWAIIMVPIYLGMVVLWGQTDNAIITWFAGLGVLALLGLVIFLCFMVGSAIAAFV